MASNTYKLPGSSPENSRGSVFSLLENIGGMGDLFKDGVPVRFLPHILFIMMIGILYIGNRHFAEKTIRKITFLESEVQDLRADYTTLKAEYMLATKQSEVLRRASKLGLVELNNPPYKIEIKPDEY